MEREKSVKIRICIKRKTFIEMAQAAENKGFRRKGLFPYVQKPHGFANEEVPNTKGLAKFLHYCFKVYRENELEHQLKAKEALERLRLAELEAQKYQTHAPAGLVVGSEEKKKNPQEGGGVG